MSLNRNDILEEHLFGVGQKAVYPCHGVGTIETIQACSVGGSKQDFYVIKIHSTGAKVMVPTLSAKTVGLRSVISIPEVEKVYKILQLPSKKSTATWNRRFRTLNDKLNTGNLSDIAEVLRDLSYLSTDKDLSFGERKMLERARGMFVSEVSVALNKDENDIHHDLNQRLFEQKIAFAHEVSAALNKNVDETQQDLDQSLFTNSERLSNKNKKKKK